MEQSTSLKSLEPPKLDRTDRDGLLDYFTDTWDLYELLFGAITGDGALYLNPDPLRHPLIFYLGHTAAFYVNKLELAGLLDEGLHERFEHLFAVGVDPAEAEELGTELWPREEEVHAYRARVFELVSDLIGRVEIRLPITDEDPLWSLLMGFEHDRIHFETSSVLIRQYALDSVTRPESWVYAPLEGSASTAGAVEIPGGRVTLGKPRSFPTFGWDNEYGRLEVDVAPFQVSPDLVTNGEFLEFVREGGYARRELWTDEGWEWREATGSAHPKFWIGNGDGYRYRAMFDELDLPASWPVEVNALEAGAYCRWKGDGWRLPTEAEHARVASEASRVDGDSVFADGYNLSLAYGSPTPVGFMAAGTTPSGVRDIYGNVWEWLADDFYPLPGFETHRLYRDFSEPYMDDQHSMMIGGAWASSGTSASRFYRLWFRRFFFQHAGFRLARSGA